jgi:hypothetical protein
MCYDTQKLRSCGTGATIETLRYRRGVREFNPGLACAAHPPRKVPRVKPDLEVVVRE